MASSDVAKLGAGFLVGAGLAYYLCQETGGKKVPLQTESTKEDNVVGVVLRFLHAQTARDLDLMCALAHQDIVYINEPHPPERTIRGKAMFREVFADSPCIWCKDARLQVLQYARNGDTVFVERLDEFYIQGKWLKIPICGYLKVKGGKVVFWKDYWDYKKYKDFVVANYGADFRLFRKTVDRKQQ